jgi:predicted FMN-binding regulatory protein PaiB
MYSDEKFIVKDLAEIRVFVEKYPFATVVATGSLTPFCGFMKSLIGINTGKKEPPRLSC